MLSRSGAVQTELDGSVAMRRNLRKHHQVVTGVVRGAGSEKQSSGDGQTDMANNHSVGRVMTLCG